MPNVGEFVATLAVDTSAGVVTVKDLISSFGQLEASTLGEIGALSTLAVAIGEMADHGMQLATSFRDFTAQTGLSAIGLQQWQRVGTQLGINADSVASSLKNLSQELFETALTGKNFAVYARLGIDPRGKDALQFLETLRGRLKSLSAVAASHELRTLGLDPAAIIPLLRLTDAEFKKLAGVATGMTADQQRGFLDMQRELGQMKVQAQDLADALGLWAKPLVDDLAFIVNGFHEANVAIIGVTAALGALGIAVAAVMLPWFATALAVSAAIVSIGLAIDDVISHFRGGKSVLVDMFKAFEGGDALEILKNRMMSILPDVALRLAPSFAGGGGTTSITNNIVVHDSSGRPHEAVRDEYKRAMDDAHKQLSQ